MRSAAEIALPDGLTRLEQALVYASRLHDGHTRKGTAIPYVSHLLAVAGIVLEHGGTEDQVVAALLHDAVEDQGARPTLEDIRRRFGDEVAAIVEGCSDDDDGPRDGSTWHARKERYLAHLGQASSAVRLVSAADKLHNARAILGDLQIHGDALWSRFNASPGDILWYYRRLVEIFRASGPHALAAELARVVEEIGRGCQAPTSPGGISL